MTELKKNPSAISNYFNRIEAGIAPRGGSFMDADAVDHDDGGSHSDEQRRTLVFTHDGDGNRFLFRELKEPNELALSLGTRSALRNLSVKPGITVWGVRRLDGEREGKLHFWDARTNREGIITVEAYRAKLNRWWHEHEDHHHHRSRSADTPAGGHMEAARHERD